ncbi:MAG: terminase small subunit [Proteobacteria bacterium]|nr:terminase small subunit [Pseudomonadota bacterium]
MAANRTAAKPKKTKPTSKSTRSELTAKQEAFAKAYVLSGNASEAYRSAYDAKAMAAKTVTEKASRLLANGKVRARVSALQGKVKGKAEQKFELTADNLLAKMVALASSDPTDFASWGKRAVTKHTKEGQAYTVDEAFVDLTESSALTPEQRLAVAAIEMSVSRDGRPIPSLKLHDRAKAIEALWRMLGYEHDSKNPARKAFDLGPLETVSDCLDAQRRITAALAAGELTEAHAEALERRVTATAKLHEGADLAARLERLEQILAARNPTESRDARH